MDVFEEAIDSILAEMMRLPPVPLIVRYLCLTICPGSCTDRERGFATM